MKLTTFAEVLALGMVLSVAATGCKHHPPPITPLGQTGGTLPNQQPGPGAAVPGSGTEPGSGTLSGIPQGSGHPGWTETRDTFQADTAHFDYDSAVVKPEDQPKLSAVADYLKANTADAVKIEGHCDERGTEEYNRALGERRALALREELVRLGIDPTRVDTVSYGKDRPEDAGHDEAAWKKNRRGVFVLLSPPR
jgi:peptidoglycan-associated lipoprotein